MKKLFTVLLLASMAALAGCGDNSSSPAPVKQPAVSDRTLTINTSNPNFLKTGMSIDITGVAAGNDGVALSVPIIPIGTLGLAVAVTDPIKTELTVLSEPVNGIYSAKLVVNNVPAGTYKIKAVSVGFAPAFKTYSASVNYIVK